MILSRRSSPAMSTILSLPEELVIEIMVNGDHRMLVACQRACRTFRVVIKGSLALQYIIALSACGMRDGLSSTALCHGTAVRLQRLYEHEAAWREVAWSDSGAITHEAARDLPTAISGGVLAFLKQSDGNAGSPELGDRLFLLRVPSKLRGIPGDSWELNGLGEMFNLCIDSAQDLLLFNRAGNFHVRALSSGKVHPLVFHSGAFEMGTGTSDALVETPAVCCDHVAGIVQEHGWSQVTLSIKGTIVVWNWRRGSQVAVIRPWFARIGRDIAFLDETHLLIPASPVNATLRPGQNYELMLLVYDFEPSAATFVNQVATTPYCFHVSLPVRTGITTFRNVRISANTASFSQPVNPSPRGYFFPDPRERVITVEVVDDNWMQSMGETAELYVPARTFLAYIAAHPPSATKLSTAMRSPPADVPWETWGPRGSHLVRTPDQTHIIRRPRACGMRVLGASLSEKSVVVTDFHPGRVARSARVGVGTLATTGTAGTTSSATSERARALVPSTFSEMQQEQGLQARRSALVCATKEVPLPRELRDASESPWMMLCEDALLAFEYVPDGFEISRVFAYTF